MKTVKYFGCNISSYLSWNTHINLITKKANNTLGFIRRNTFSCPSSVKEKCYKSLVRPQVEYSSTVWDPFTQANENKIEQIQRRAARYVTGDYRRTSSVTSMLQQLSWDSSKQRRQYAKVTMMYRIVHQLIAIPVVPHLVIPAVTYTRGHSWRYMVPPSRLQLHKGSFFPSTIRLWNSLPSNTVAAANIETFRSRLLSIP